MRLLCVSAWLLLAGSIISAGSQFTSFDRTTPGSSSKATGSRAARWTADTASAFTTTSSPGSESSSSTWGRAASSRCSRTWRTSTGPRVPRQSAEAVPRRPRRRPRETAVGNSVAQPGVHRDARRRIAHGVRELVHRPRAAREDVTLTAPQSSDMPYGSALRCGSCARSGARGGGAMFGDAAPAVSAPARSAAASRCCRTAGRSRRPAGTCRSAICRWRWSSRPTAKSLLVANNGYAKPTDHGGRHRVAACRAARSCSITRGSASRGIRTASVSTCRAPGTTRFTRCDVGRDGQADARRRSRARPSDGLPPGRRRRTDPSRCRRVSSAASRSSPDGRALFAVHVLGRRRQRRST